jgi:nucleoside-diphosphate-sugar epimerase
MRVLVTGSTGFVGQQVVEFLLQKKHEIVTCSRSNNVSFIERVKNFEIPDINEVPNWDEIIKSSDCVIHLAARVHMMNDSHPSQYDFYKRINRDATIALAEAAAKAGVKRFIFLSSVKVNGEITSIGNVFRAEDKNVPSDLYGLSKYEAEQGLFSIAEKTGMEVVIIRSPLVYGPRVKGNFAKMVKWIKKGIPLPFGAIRNQRSLVALDNVVDFIVFCADREITPLAANQVFLVSDGEDVSTTELMLKIALAYGVKSHLLPISSNVMRFVAKLLGKTQVADRLFGNLQIDSSKARNLLGWEPVSTMDEQLAKMAQHDLNREKMENKS